MRKYIIALVVVLSFMACNRHSEHWEALCQVETFIEEQPDSALVVLQGIDAGDLSSAEERAKHAVKYIFFAPKFGKFKGGGKFVGGNVNTVKTAKT